MALEIDGQTRLHILTDGENRVISPIRPEKDRISDAEFKRASDEMMARYEAAFRAWPIEDRVRDALPAPFNVFIPNEMTF